MLYDKFLCIWVEFIFIKDDEWKYNKSKYKYIIIMVVCIDDFVSYFEVWCWEIWLYWSFLGLLFLCVRKKVLIFSWLKVLKLF